MYACLCVYVCMFVHVHACVLEELWSIGFGENFELVQCTFIE